MKTFKGKAWGWFYADRLCRDREENLVPEGVGGQQGLQSSWWPVAGRLRDGRLRDSSQGRRQRGGWGVYAGQRAETQEEGNWPFCALVSPFAIGAPAWVS